MKVVQIATDPVTENLRSGDPVRREKALRELYFSPKIAGKLRDWASFYGLKKGMGVDDVLQEAMEKLEEKARTGVFRGECRADTFLLAICKNIIRDGAKKVEKVIFKAEILDYEQLSDENRVAEKLLFESLEEAEADRDTVLLQAMDALGEGCSDALTLYYFENFNMEKVADSTGLANAGQAKKKVHRCRERLREAIVSNPLLAKILKPGS